MNAEILKKITDSNRNLLISGGMSTGKTKKVGFPLINKMIESKESLFILDSKSEYLNKYYELLKEKKYNIVIINHRDLNNSEGWNPLEYSYNLYKKGQKDKALNYIEQLGKEIFYEENVIDPFWIQSASDLFTGITLGLFEDGDKSEINLNSVNNMLNTATDKLGTSNCLTEYFKTKKVTDTACVYASSTIYAPTETRGSIVSVAKQKLRILVSRDLLNQHLNKTTFDLDKILDKPTAIFFIAREESPYLSSLVSFFINQLYSILIDRNNKNSFNFILDNFDYLIDVNDLIPMLSVGVSRNIKFIISTRFKEKLEKHYGDYINSLVNEIKVNEKSIELQIGDEETKIRNTKARTKLEDANVEYHKLKTSNIKIFDIKGFMADKNSEIISQEKIVESSNIANLLKTIDSKIAELEAEEKEEMINTAQNNNSVKSDLEQFKIEK